MKTIGRISKVVWGLVGILMLAVMALTISIGVDIKTTTVDIKEIVSDATIGDMRSILDVIDKQLDIDILSLELQRERTNSPLEWTVENWRDYLDFCGKYGYVVSDYTWQEYRYGRLKP